MAGEHDHNPLAQKPFDASDPEQVKEREREVARRERDNREVLVTLLATPGGRNWMWQVLSGCNVFSQSFVPGADQTATAFNEGRRSVGNEILAAVMRASPDTVVQLLKEQGKAK